MNEQLNQRSEWVLIQLNNILSRHINLGFNETVNFTKISISVQSIISFVSDWLSIN